MIGHLAAGFALGWVGSMPIAGAVSILVFQRGLSGRLKDGLILAGGAALAEAGWCLLALLGATRILARWPHLETIARLVGVAILLALGVYFLTRKTPAPTLAETDTPPTGKLREFWLGFLLVAGNISVPVNWLALLTVALGLGFHPDPAHHFPFLLGVFLGIVGWFALLLKIMAALRARFDPGRLQWILRAMGALLILAAGLALFR